MTSDKYSPTKTIMTPVQGLQKGIAISGGNLLMEGNLGYFYGLSGQKENAMEILDDLLTRSREVYVSPFNIALVYSGLGQWDRALDYLNAALEERRYAFMFAAVDTCYDPIREDPRFQDLLRRMNLLD